MTVRDLINGSLRLIGAIASGETASASESSDALTAFNDLLESWSLNGFLVYRTSTETFTIPGSQSSYTIGVGGNFDTEVPLTLQGLTYIQGGSNVENPVEILNDEQWQNISDKTQAGSLPTYAIYNYDYPLASIQLWPIPNAGGSLVVYSQKKISSYASINEELNLPAAYAKALRYNLAVELAPEYGKEASNTVIAIAQDSKYLVSRVNDKPIFMENDAIGLFESKTFNIYRGS